MQAALFLTAGLALSATSGAFAATAVFVNELHYDNAGSDTAEGVEIAGRAGTDLAGWTILLYNGGNGTVYRTTPLGGVIADQSNGYGTLYFATGSLQNGSPDGLALVDAGGSVRQFLSYEGSFTASAGAAAGMTSLDIGPGEAPDTPAGFSLQLAGTGRHYEDFAWALPALHSYGAVNAGQSFAAVPLPATLPMMLGALALLQRARRRPTG